MAKLAHRPNNLIYLKCTDESFFRTFVEIYTPWHNLASREKDVMAKIISQYFKLRQQCEDPTMLRELLWSQSSRQDMRESLGMQPPHFLMVMKKLRDAGVLLPCGSTNCYDINPKFLPHIQPSSTSKSFELRIVFDYSTTEQPEVPSHETVTTGPAAD